MESESCRWQVCIQGAVLRDTRLPAILLDETLIELEEIDAKERERATVIFPGERALEIASLFSRRSVGEDIFFFFFTRQVQPC